MEIDIVSAYNATNILERLVATNTPYASNNRANAPRAMSYCAEVAVEVTFRRMAEKICSKVNRRKGDGAEERREILLAIASGKEYLAQLLYLCEVTGDAGTACMTLSILRECVAAKSQWRGACLMIMVELNATERVLKTVTRFNTDGSSGSFPDQGLVCAFWVLSALATKDPQFSLRFRLSGALRLVETFLARLACRAVGLYPMLQTIKALSRNQVVSVVLGRDGVVDTVVTVLSSLVAKKYGPRTKVALEALLSLTKAKQNLSLLSESTKSFRTLLDLLAKYEEHSGSETICLKIVSSILFLLLRAIKTEYAQEQFKKVGGIATLRDFCVNFKARDKRWNRILIRASSVICLCTEGIPLPVSDQKNPLQFDLGDIKTSGNYHVSTPRSMSRETTPDDESLEDEEEEEDDDYEYYYDDDDNEDDNFAEEADNEAKVPTNDSLTLTTSTTTTTISKPTFTRSRSSLEENYVHLFKELSTAVGESDISSNNQHSQIKETSDDFERYVKLSSTVGGLINFVKVSYPDAIGAVSPFSVEYENLVPEREPLLESGHRNCRSKIAQNVRNLLGESPPFDRTVVFDLDKLVKEGGSSKDGEITNDDSKRVLEARSKDSNARWSPLKFESRFEGGNLRLATQTGRTEYELVLTPDASPNTSSSHSQHHQWFHFQVEGVVRGVQYTFDVVNCEKANSQYNFGMQPLLFSVRESLEGRPFWRRVGSDVFYYKNQYIRNNSNNKNKKKHYQTASFTVTFPHSGDVCYLAYHYPYTYTKLLHFLETLPPTITQDVLFRRDELCRSVRGHTVPMLTITSRNQSEFRMRQRKLVLLTARVHPGETNSSWAMQGTLSFLCGRDARARRLRSRHIFKIIPMLNVEGVVNGCHRCGLTGEDLNRRWANPVAQFHPEIYHARGCLEYCSEMLGIKPYLFVDYHGHSRKKNVFLYGCSQAQSWLPSDAELMMDPTKSYLDLENALEGIESCFDKKSCKYVIEKTRESTARVVLWRQFKVNRSYTMETTYCGFSKKLEKGCQINTWHLLSVGRSLAMAILNLDNNQQTSGENQEETKKKILMLKMPQVELRPLSAI